MKVKVKVKINATFKLLNTDLVYLAARTKSLSKLVSEISVLLYIENLKFKMATKNSNMADRQTEHTLNAHLYAAYIHKVLSQFKENCRRRFILSAFFSLYTRPIFWKWRSPPQRQKLANRQKKHTPYGGPLRDDSL